MGEASPQSGKVAQKKSKRFKAKSKPKVPPVRASVDVKRIEDSYAELSINPAPDIFHNDIFSLKNEMIDHAKAARVRSQLRPVLSQLRNQAYQDYFSNKNE